MGWAWGNRAALVESHRTRIGGISCIKQILVSSATPNSEILLASPCVVESVAELYAQVVVEVFLFVDGISILS